ncbi:MAG: hypothetical protein ACI9JN_002713 [Bacteroidia bacterium]|jgi:hypothetical protein
MHIEGTWEGYYEYGDGYVLPHFGERVGIMVTFQGENEEFSGTVKEDGSTFSVPLQAKIMGVVEYNVVSFIKTYPKNPRIKEEGKADLYFDDGELEIYHSGYWDEKSNSMYGWWSITSEFEDENGVFESVTSGIWLLKKVT